MGLEVEQEVRKSEQNEADGRGEGHLAGMLEAGSAKGGLEQMHFEMKIAAGDELEQGGDADDRGDQSQSPSNAAARVGEGLLG